jgi:hypothetical protein
MKIIPIYSVLVLTTIAAAGSGAPNHRIALAGLCSIDGGKTKIPFAIEATSVQYNPKIHTGPLLGTNRRVPLYVCSAFAVSIGGRDILIPEKAYSDLGDIHTIKPVEREGNRWAVEITGGDGAGFYELDFIFDSNRLLERWSVIDPAILGGNVPKFARKHPFKEHELIWRTEKY